jgi:hypothetical protein
MKDSHSLPDKSRSIVTTSPEHIIMLKSTPNTNNNLRMKYSLDKLIFTKRKEEICISNQNFEDIVPFSIEDSTVT